MTLTVFVEMTTLLLWTVGLMYSNAGDARVGSYTGLLVCIQSSLNFFNLILVTYLDSREAIVGTANIFDRYDILDGHIKGENKKTEVLHHYEVSVRNMSFGFRDIDVFENFNLEIEDGEFVEIRGEKGCGKTTLVKLILGLYEEYAGKITIGGMDIRTVDLSNYIAYVPANDFFFDGNVCFNIALKQECSREEKERIRQILKKLCFRDMAIDDLFEKSISKLSSGEKQRIAVARALYRDTPILIMDEYNANLDTDTENQIFESIKKNYGEKTIIMINHKKEYLDSRKVYL